MDTGSVQDEGTPRWLLIPRHPLFMRGKTNSVTNIRMSAAVCPRGGRVMNQSKTQSCSMETKKLVRTQEDDAT